MLRETSRIAAKSGAILARFAAVRLPMADEGAEGGRSRKKAAEKRVRSVDGDTKVIVAAFARCFVEVCPTSGLPFLGEARGVPHPLPSAGYRIPHMTPLHGTEAAHCIQ